MLGVVLAVIEQEFERILRQAQSAVRKPAPFLRLDRAKPLDDEHGTEQAERIALRGLVEHPARQGFRADIFLRILDG